MHINKTTFIAGMLVAVMLGVGLIISVPEISATAFTTNPFGIQFGDGTRTMTQTAENLIYGVVANSSVGSLLLLQDGPGVDRFRVDTDGNVTADGTLILGGTFGLQNTATRPTCDSGILGHMVFDTVEDKPYVCASSAWKPLDSDYDKDGIVDWNDWDDTDSNKKEVDLTTDNIKSGVDIFGVTGSLEEGLAISDAACVSSNDSAGNRIFVIRNITTESRFQSSGSFSTWCREVCGKTIGARSYEATQWYQASPTPYLQCECFDGGTSCVN
jgi:hypothetical protein